MILSFCVSVNCIRLNGNVKFFLLFFLLDPRIFYINSWRLWRVWKPCSIYLNCLFIGLFSIDPIFNSSIWIFNNPCETLWFTPPVFCSYCFHCGFICRFDYQVFQGTYLSNILRQKNNYLQRANIRKFHYQYSGIPVLGRNYRLCMGSHHRN